MSKSASFRRAVAVLGCIGALAVAPAHAQLFKTYQSWGTVGSNGVVDDGDTGEVALNERTANFKRGAVLPATAILRYNMPAGALGPYNEGGSNPRWFWVRYLDNGTAASVNLKLKRSSTNSDTITTVWSWSSDNETTPVSTSYRQASQCVYGPDTDYNPIYSYWLEVELIKRDSTGSVGFAEFLAERDPGGFCPF